MYRTMSANHWETILQIIRLVEVFKARNFGKHENVCISKTVLDRAIPMEFLTHRVSLHSSHPSLPKNYVSLNMVAILIFRIFCKNCKTQKCLYLKTVLDRAISTVFLTHRVSLHSSHPSFPKNYVSVNMAAILNFRIFCKNWKTQKCL